MSVVINLPTPRAKEPDTMVRHQVERIRHETRRRSLTVETAVKLTPNMLRISFTADDLGDFISLSALEARSLLTRETIPSPDALYPSRVGGNRWAAYIGIRRPERADLHLGQDPALRPDTLA